jgi:hypothetical protein
MNKIKDWKILKIDKIKRYNLKNGGTCIDKFVSASCSRCNSVIENKGIKTLKYRKCKKCSSGKTIKKYQNKYNDTIINNWHIIEVLPGKEGYPFEYLARARCMLCQREYVRGLAPLRKERSLGCNDCAYKARGGHFAKVWTGGEFISGRLFWSIKSSALKRNLEFNVTIQDLEDQFNNQFGRCGLSGIELKIKNKRSEFNGRRHCIEFSNLASLDRIDSSKGYIKGNIMWISATINVMKTALSKDDFLKIIKIILDYNQPQA